MEAGQEQASCLFAQIPWLLEGTGLPTNRGAFFKKKTGFQKQRQSLLPKHLRFFMKTGNQGLETPPASFSVLETPNFRLSKVWVAPGFLCGGVGRARERTGGFSVLVLPPVVSQWHYTLVFLCSVLLFYLCLGLNPGPLLHQGHSALSHTPCPVAAV